MGKMSKTKGKGFETEVAKFLSETYGDNFMRVPFSGALIGGTNAKRKSIMTEGQIRTFKGDIIPPDDWSSFHCETKFYKEFSFTSVFSNEYALLNEWIREVRDAEEPDDLNLIIMKFNYKGRWVLYEQKHPFVVTNKLDYKEWYLCSWENFWTEENTDTVQYLSKR
jgi:hypothetical protein